MKALHKIKNSSCQTEAKKLTWGDLIATTHSAREKQGTPKILQLAIDSHLVWFMRPLFLG